MKLDPTRPPESDDYYLGIALAVRRKANCTGNRVAAVLSRISASFPQATTEYPRA